MFDRRRRPVRTTISETVRNCRAPLPLALPALPSSPAFFMVEGPWRWRARRAALARTPVPTELHAEVLAWCMGSARAVRQPSLAEQVAPVARVIFDDATSTGHVLRVRVLCCRGCSAVTYARARRGAVSVARSTPCACARAVVPRGWAWYSCWMRARAAVRGVRRGAARALAQLAATSVARLISASSMASARGWRSSTRTRLYVGSAGRWFFGCGSERRCNFFA